MRLKKTMSSSRRKKKEKSPGENISKVGKEPSPADASEKKKGILQGMQQSTVGWLEEVDPLNRLAVHLARLGQAAEGAHTGGEVVQRGQVSEIATVAAKQYLAQVDQAVDGLLDRRDAPGRRPVAVFHLSVVLEE